MASLERFFSPSVRFFDKNLKSLPGARLYFFAANSTTPKATFADKIGETPNSNPVVADSNGIFPPIFLSGLYRVELRDTNNIVQPGWPIDNVGQDSAIVPFAPWSEIVTYQADDVVTSPDGFWFRSRVDGNIGLDPDENPDQWELIIVPSETVLKGFIESVVPAYQEEVVELGGEFSENESVVCVRHGSVVTIGATKILNHAAGSSVISAIGVIPEIYRPSSMVRNGYDAGAGSPTYQRTVAVGEDGTFFLAYIHVDDGTPSGQTNSGSAPNITFIVE